MEAIIQYFEIMNRCAYCDNCFGVRDSRWLHEEPYDDVVDSFVADIEYEYEQEIDLYCSQYDSSSNEKEEEDKVKDEAIVATRAAYAKIEIIDPWYGEHGPYCCGEKCKQQYNETLWDDVGRDLDGLFR
jgi:hypothetical protein